MTQVSQTPTAPAATPPTFTKEAAGDFANRQIFIPYFLDKLASAGVRPESEDEAWSLVRLGAKLLNLNSLNGVKQASSRLDFLKQAEADLDQALQQQGIATPNSAAMDQAIEKEAQELASNELYRAAVTAGLAA